MAAERWVPKIKGISLMPMVLEANSAVKYSVKAKKIFLSALSEVDRSLNIIFCLVNYLEITARKKFFPRRLLLLLFDVILVAQIFN